MGDGEGGTCPPTFLPPGDKLCSVPPTFWSWFWYFYRPNLDVACLGRYWAKKARYSNFCFARLKIRELSPPPTFRDKITPMWSWLSFIQGSSFVFSGTIVMAVIGLKMRRNDLQLIHGFTLEDVQCPGFSPGLVITVHIRDFLKLLQNAKFLM